MLIEAMRQVEGTFIIIGRGYLENRLRRRIRNLGLDRKIRIEGRVSDSELLSYYRRADVFVLPSVSRTESYGLVQLEAMALGTPVVCTELGTGTSFVNRDGETGFVVPPGDSNASAESINRTLTDEVLAGRFSKNAETRYRSLFSEEKMVENLLKLYEEVLGG